MLLLLPTITAIFFITDYNVFFDSNVQAERQSQSTNTVCNGEQDSCFTTFCSNDQPCQTFPSKQLPSIVKPVEEATVTQPVEMSQEYIEATLEVCDDGQDNDVDGKVDTQDEECNATSSSSPSPIQGQSMSEDQREGEDDKQQSVNDKIERPSQEVPEESGEDDEGEKDEDDNNEQHDENDDNKSLPPNNLLSRSMIPSYQVSCNKYYKDDRS